MQFHQKLRKRVQELGLNKSKAARDAGLPDSTISSYLAKPESLPRIDIALKLASALDVPLSWLADDSLDWPPPPLMTGGAQQLSTQELMSELSRRFRIEAVRIWEDIQRAEKTDWTTVGIKMLSGDLDRPFTADLQLPTRLYQSLENASLVLSFFDLSIMSAELPDVPGAGIDPRELRTEKLMERIGKLREKFPGMVAVGEALTIRFGLRGWPKDSEELNAWRKRALAELEAKKPAENPPSLKAGKPSAKPKPATSAKQ